MSKKPSEGAVFWLYIAQPIDKNVNICHTITDEKVPSCHFVSEHVHWRVQQFHDVEGTGS